MKENFFIYLFIEEREKKEEKKQERVNEFDIIYAIELDIMRESKCE